MKIATREDYIKSLRELHHTVYFNGQKIEDVTTHPAFVPHINAAAKTYEMALRPEFEDLATATSHLTGERISRFTHIHQSIEDLIKKVQLLRAISHETATCFQRCVGWDALNAIYMTTYDMDRKNGTDYEIARLAHDISGGILATMPFESDLRSAETGPIVQKYMAGVEGVSPENRLRVLRLIENLTGGTALVEAMHGAGSPQSQKVMYGRLGNLEMKKKMAKKIVGIEE